MRCEATELVSRLAILLIPGAEKVRRKSRCLRMPATAVGAEVDHRFPQASLQPHLRLTADVISGDDNSDDPELGMLDPLFPRGKYFASQSPIGPCNLIISGLPSRSVRTRTSSCRCWVRLLATKHRRRNLCNLGRPRAQRQKHRCASSGRKPKSP
jgi:hypothetical protein